MRRRRSTPWIHRWARPAIATIAGVGLVETLYLSIIKLMGASAACPTDGCDAVLNSPYALVFGIPLTLFGAAAYLSMMVFALAPYVVSQDNKERWRTVEETTGTLLLVGGTAMMMFSGYLMYLLIFEVQELCIYCLASATFSLSLFVLSAVGRFWEDTGKAIFIGLLVALVTLTGTVGIYATTNKTGETPAVTGNAPPPVTTTSGPAEIALAEHLSQIGAMEYGAYWCPHCHDQKQLFGAEAAAKLNYVECDPKGQNSQTDRCRAAQIRGFPTWEIKGEQYSGVRQLQELATISGYTGSRNFQNELP